MVMLVVVAAALLIVVMVMLVVVAAAFLIMVVLVLVAVAFLIVMMVVLMRMSAGGAKRFIRKTPKRGGKGIGACDRRKQLCARQLRPIGGYDHGAVVVLTQCFGCGKQLLLGKPLGVA